MVSSNVRGRRRAVAALLPLATALSMARAQDAPPTIIEGLVVDEEGAPIADAGVGMFTGRQLIETARLLADPTCRTDEAGQFRIAHRTGFDLLAITAPKRQTFVKNMRGLEPGTNAIGAIVLPPGGLLAGRIRGRDGEPLAGARVRVTSPLVSYFVLTKDGGFLADAVTEANGNFVVRSVPRTGLSVTVTAPGYRSRSFFAAHYTPLDLTLESLGFARGRVVDTDGAPVEGAVLFARSAEPQRLLPADLLRSGEDGRFEISVPCPGDYVVSARAETPVLQVASSGGRGPVNDLVLQLAPAEAHAPRAIPLRLVDAATGAEIPRFRATALRSQQIPQLAMLTHLARAREYESGDAVPVHSARSVFIEAAGHAWTVAPVPDDDEEEWTVALDAEAIVTGRVVRTDTGAPIPGAAVRALPAGKSMGTGQDPRHSGVITDADGRYRVAGLKPGAYHVQVLPPGEAVSPPHSVEVTVDQAAVCDIEVGAPRFLEFSFRGELAASVPCSVRWKYGSSNSKPGHFDYAPKPWTSQRLRTGQDYRLGPLSSAQYLLEIWKPSRVRIGMGTAISLPLVDPDDGPVVFDVPDLGGEIVRGRVDLPADAPGERIAVAAWPIIEGKVQRGYPAPAQSAMLGVDGTFEIDLPHGRYSLHLADLETHILFHTEPTDVVIESGMEPLRIQPSIQWLEIDVQPERALEDYRIAGIEIEVALPRADRPALLEATGFSPRTESRWIEFHADSARRWLVPRAEVELTARLRSRRLGEGGTEPIELAPVTVLIDEARHQVTLQVPGDGSER